VKGDFCDMDMVARLIEQDGIGHLGAPFAPGTEVEQSIPQSGFARVHERDSMAPKPCVDRRLAVRTASTIFSTKGKDLRQSRPFNEARRGRSILDVDSSLAVQVIFVQVEALLD
jgi:hypothetical protein